MNIPISKVYFDKDEERQVTEVLRSGWVMQGKKVEELEESVAKYIGVKFAVAVSSGTAALHLSLLALRITKGDEVIVPSYSFVASANCILYVGATPIFVDVDEFTYNIDPLDVEKKVSKKTKAIIAVHQMGLPCNLSAIQKICNKYKLFLVEDAACALGASYKGRLVGSFGDLACFSFHPRKSITTGEGGIVTTNSKLLCQKLISLRSHGIVKKNGEEIFVELGYNYRMTDLQGAIGLAQLHKLNMLLSKREKIAQRYSEMLRRFPSVISPFVSQDMKHTYQSYMIRITDPKLSVDALARALEEKGIASKKGITLIHKEPLYRKLFGMIHLPITEKLEKEALILPLYPQMTASEQDYVIKILTKAIFV